MKSPVISFVFDRKKVGSESRKAPVELRIYYGKRTLYRSTGISVTHRQWEPKGERIVAHGDALFLNGELQRIHSKALRAVTEAARRDGFTIQDIADALEAGRYDGKFMDFVEDCIEKRTDIRESTKHSHRRLLLTMKEFGGMVRFSDLTRQEVRRFDEWLHGRYAKQSTVHTYHKIVKAYINIAIGRGMLDRNPYAGFKCSKGERRTRLFLTDDELRRVREIETSDLAVCRARDLFLFQCYTGLSFADMMRFDFSQAVRENGRYMMKGRRLKSGEEYFIVLMDGAMEILRRYDFRLPVISNQKYNLHLKAVAAHAGLRFNLTTHCGRHTFATMAINKGVSVEVLKRMMGHSDIRTTMIYAKILNSPVEGAFERLNGTF